MPNQPVVLAAIVTFTGVLITVVVGTVANFLLAQRRNLFERELARMKFDFDSQLSRERLENERSAREATRIEAVRLRNSAFQRETLLELQESILSLLRCVNQIQLRDIQFSRQEGKWGKPLVADEISEECRRLHARTTILTSRVHSAQIREAALEIKRYCSRVVSSESEEESQSNLDEVTLRFASFNEDVGRMIRQIDESDLAAGG